MFYDLDQCRQMIAAFFYLSSFASAVNDGRLVGRATLLVLVVAQNMLRIVYVRPPRPLIFPRPLPHGPLVVPRLNGR